MGQPPSLREQLRRCTVQLLVPNKSLGTGFFVAPGLILTCAHVIQIAQENNTSIEVSAWDGRAIGPGSIQKFVVEKIPARENLPGQKIQYLYPDLALLQVKLMDHPCVYLDAQVRSGDLLYAYGYPDNYPGGDEVEFAFEGESRIDQQRYLVKFGAGEARPGFSGAPLMNLSTGGVCGVIQTTRGSDLGGRAIPTSIVFEEFPELLEQQKLFHQRDKGWYDCLTQEQREKLGMATPTEGIEVFFLYADVDEDKRLLTQLETHLATIQRQGLITTWNKGKIEFGADEQSEMNKHLNKARIILLLVSSDFMAAHYRDGTGVQQAMEKRATGTIVIPVILRPADWKTSPFGGLTPLPRDGKPITRWSDRDEAFLEVAQGIRSVVGTLQKANPR